MKTGSIGRRVFAIMLSFTIAAGGGGMFMMRTARNVYAEVKKEGTVDNFAKKLSIADVTIDPGKITGANATASVTGTGLRIGGQGQIEYTGRAEAGATKEVDGTATYVFKEAATLSDGITKADIKITYSNFSVTGYDPNSGSGELTGTITLVEGPASQLSSAKIKDYNNEDQWAYSQRGTVTISINGGTDFVLPARGFNQYKNSNSTDTGWYQWYANGGDALVRETAIIPGSTATNVYVPESINSEATTDSSGATTVRATTANGGNDSYNSGFAIDGAAAGAVFDFISVAAKHAKTVGGEIAQANQAYLRLGDLTHTIWSSTTPGGNIQTTRGTDLEAANADHDLNDGTEKLDPGYYSVPNYKAVTYTMDSAPGYRIRKLYVDGSEATPAGMEKLEGAVNRYWYTFEADATNHEIFVEWEPIPADVDVTKVWEDSGETDARPSELIVKLSPEGYLPAQKITNTKTGNEQSVTGWGHNNAWTGADGTAVVKEPTTMGWRSYSGSDAPFTTIFYDTGDKTWYNYTINNSMTTYGYPTGYTKGAAITQKVDFLPKYSGSAEVEYSVTEDPNPPADYTAVTSVNKVNTGRDKDVDKTAEYDVTITNTYDAPAPPVIEEEEIELSRKITYQYIDKNGKMAQETKVQKVRLKRTREQGQDFWEPWVAEGSFPAVTSPTEKEDPVRLTNWVPDRNAPALSKEDIEKAANAKIPTDRNIDGLTDTELAALLSEISDSFTQAIFYHPPSLKPEPASPQKGEVKAANTGDETNQGLPAAVMMFSLTGAVMMVYTLRKRRQAK